MYIRISFTQLRLSLGQNFYTSCIYIDPLANWCNITQISLTVHCAEYQPEPVLLSYSYFEGFELIHLMSTWKYVCFIFSLCLCLCGRATLRNDVHFVWMYPQCCLAGVEDHCLPNLSCDCWCQWPCDSVLFLVDWATYSSRQPRFYCLPLRV